MRFEEIARQLVQTTSRLVRGRSVTISAGRQEERPPRRRLCSRSFSALVPLPLKKMAAEGLFDESFKKTLTIRSAFDLIFL